MRPKVITVAAALVLVAAATAWSARSDEPEPEALKPPTLRIEQTSEAVKIHVHNANEHWELRDQHVVIDLHNKTRGFSIVRSYGPDDEYGPERPDGRMIRCCRITHLPPGGTFTFTLWPSSSDIVAATIDLYGEVRWQYVN